MRFCRDCGKAVAILGDPAQELCRECAQAVPSPQVPSRSPFDAELMEAHLTVEDGKIHLVSREGWLLWSGSTHRPHTLQQITDQASRILKIRKRKK